MATMEDLEGRVDRLERDVQEIRHAAETGLRAVGTGVNLIHADLSLHRRETAAGFAEVRAEIVNVRTELGAEINGVTERLDRMETALAQILDRLPPPPGG